MKLFIGHLSLIIGLAFGSFIWQNHKPTPDWERVIDITYFQAWAVGICFVFNKWIWKGL